jgi:Tfp pilus assembly protein PilE
MKLRFHHPCAQAKGITLIECLVYVAVFSILLGLGTAAFYLCWDNTRAVIGTADKIETALRAGERWRADVRSATGAIAIETTTDGETVRIPEAGREIVYRFAGGEVHRDLASPPRSQLLFEKVKTSEMKTESRNGVTAWSWNLELTTTHRILTYPLWFTFEAVPAKS